MSNDDHTTPADRRGMDIEVLDAQIEELEQLRDILDERIRALRTEKVRLTPLDEETTDGPRSVLLGHLERLTDEEDLLGLSHERLVEEAVAEGVDRGDAEAALRQLKKRGEVYAVDEEVRRT